MNHLTAARLADTGLWHYVCISRYGTSPVGLCAQGCAGHETADEAREHYREWLIAKATFTDDKPEADTLHRCEVVGCDAFTSGQGVLADRWRRVDLCAEHRNVESLDALVGPVGDSWRS